MAKRQKVFLGAYVNSINAQNLNCRALALHIDSKRFKCSAMELQRGELSSLSGSIKIFKVCWPHRLNKYNSYFKRYFMGGRSISAQKRSVKMVSIFMLVIQKAKF